MHGRFCASLREHAMKMINFKKEKWSINKEQQGSNENAKIYYIWEQISERQKYCKVRDHCHYTGKYVGGAAHSTCNPKYIVPKEIPI